MALENKYFNSVELGALGLAVASAEGIYSMSEMEAARVWIPGRDYPSDTDLHLRPVPMKLHCVVADTTHANLIAALKILAYRMSPELGWCEFKMDRTDERCIARSRGWTLAINQVPFYQTAVEFDWLLERYPWWEDVTAQTATIASAATTGTITNGGTMSAYPVWTCTAGGTLATGFAFTVGTVTFAYTGALSAGNVVTIATDPPDCHIGTTRDIAHVSTAVDEFPTLAAGANAITAKTAGFELVATYRRRNP